MHTDHWMILGHYVNEWGEARRVGMPALDLLLHSAVLGSSGSGKSTLLRNLALQFWALGGHVIVIEPHSDLILDEEEGILAAIGPERLPAVTLVDLASPWPPHLNLVTASLSAGRAVAVESALRCLQTMERANWEGSARMREVLGGALHLLLESEGIHSSLFALHQFLVQADVRERYLRQAGAAVSLERDWWQRRLAQWSDPKRRETVADVLEPAERRVNGFLRHDLFRRALALPTLAPELALDLETLVESPTAQLILLPLQGDRLGTEGRLVFGTLFLQRLADLFFARGQQPRAGRRPTLLIIDEFPDLAGSEMGVLVSRLLAQARKFGAGVVLAAQSFSQLPREVLVEVKNNTTTKLVLRSASADEARLAAAHLGTPELVPGDVMGLERFSGYARTSVQGQIQPTFSFRALRPIRQVRGLTPLPLPAPPRALTAWEEKILYPLHALGHSQPEAAISQLVGMPPGEFQQVIRGQVAGSQQIYQSLLADPTREPHPVRRARQLAQARYGLPWWLYEAQYRRLRLGA